jgi:hypothetical protein
MLGKRTQLATTAIITSGLSPGLTLVVAKTFNSAKRRP